MIPVESGCAYCGTWRTERRNIYEDYREAFGEEPPPISGVAIMTDPDNTGERTTAYYGDIVFKKRDGVGGTRNRNDAGLQIRIALIKR